MIWIMNDFIHWMLVFRDFCSTLIKMNIWNCCGDGLIYFQLDCIQFSSSMNFFQFKWNEPQTNWHHRIFSVFFRTEFCCTDTKWSSSTCDVLKWISPKFALMNWMEIHFIDTYAHLGINFILIFDRKFNLSSTFWIKCCNSLVVNRLEKKST